MKNQFVRQIVHTEDGSSSIFLPELNEHYHSVHGAIQESEHVFIKEGFNLASKKGYQIRILEVGMGAGLNCLLTLRQSLILERQVHYTTIEPFPLAKDEWGMLNYPEKIGGDGISEAFCLLHTCDYGQEVRLSPGFILCKWQQPIEMVSLPYATYDLVYFDAFGPQVQPELWTEQVFKKVSRSVKKGGLLVTFSAKSKVKRVLKDCGFVLEHPKGPPGKREMTRAKKDC